MQFIIFKKPRNLGTIPGKATVFALPTVSSLALGSTQLLINLLKPTGHVMHQQV
jgi:hypothetical protein